MARIKRTSVDKFQTAVKEVLEEFEDYVDSSVVRDAVHKTAEETSEVIAKAAPVRKTASGGAYKRSITYGYPKRSRHKYTETVYSESPHYRLTHLLERGHATRNGGRTTSAFPHWGPGNDGIAERLVKYIREVLS